MHANGPPFSNSFLLLTFLTFRLFSFSFLQVANNVVYNVRGVSIYVENGQELNNLIAGNNVGCPTLDGCYCWDCVPSHSHADGGTEHALGRQAGIYVKVGRFLSSPLPVCRLFHLTLTDVPVLCTSLLLLIFLSPFSSPSSSRRSKS